MSVVIDKFNKIVQITFPDVEISGQLLHDEIEDYMASPEGLVNDGLAPFYGDILVPEGKVVDPNNPGVYSQIILKLSFEWQIQYWMGSGYTRIYGAKIVGGVDGQPMKATGAAGDITVMESPVDGVIVASSGAAKDIAAAVWEDADDYPEGSKGEIVNHGDYIEHTVFVNTEFAPVIGKGTELNPFSVMSNAVDYAETHGFKTLGLLASIDINKDVHNFKIYGIGGTQSVDTGIFNLDKTNFHQVELNGKYTGSIIIRDSMIFGPNTHTNGVFSNCGFQGLLEVPDNGLASIVSSYALSATGFIRPSFSIGGVTGTGILELIDFSGGVTIIDCNKTTDEVRIIATGLVELDSTCIDGTIFVIGLIKPTDNSGPNCNVFWLNIDPEKNQNVWKALYRRRYHDKVANTITIYKEDNITPEFVFDATDALSDIIPQ